MICSTSTFLRFWVVLLMDGLKIPAMSEITFGIISLPFQIHYWDSFLRDTTYLYVGIHFFFLPSTSLIFSPFLSSGFPISSCLLPTPLNWAILVHLFNDAHWISLLARCSSVTTLTTYLCLWWLILTMEADHEQQIHYLNSGCFIPLRQGNQGTGEEGDSPGASPGRTVRKAPLRWLDAVRPDLRRHPDTPGTHVRHHTEQAPAAEKVTAGHSEVQTGGRRGWGRPVRAQRCRGGRSEGALLSSERFTQAKCRQRASLWLRR